MSDRFNLSDYVTVDERIREFYKAHPKGALRRIGNPTLFDIGDRKFVAYTAGAWRDATTEHPDGVGTAWEPIPGPTPYTKDSELMNAETAAWGRAIVALGIGAKKGIASAEEVRNRRGDTEPKVVPDDAPPDPTPAPAGHPWSKMKKHLVAMRERQKLDLFWTKVSLTGITDQEWTALPPAQQALMLEWAATILADAA